jgi:hypothetical protein
MLPPYSPNRLHRQHLPSARFESKQAAQQPIFRGSKLDADPPVQGVKIARRITGNFATSSATTLFAWSSTHTTPNIIPAAHASISSTAPLPRGDAYPNPPTPAHSQLEHAPESPVSKTTPTPIAEPRRPTIQEMADALRRATANAAPPVPNTQSPQPRHMSAQDIAILTGLAKKSLSTGDIPTARLLLRRAAEAEDAGAALLLAQTYDPAVLRSSDVRPDPESARAWYEKATQFAATKTKRPPDQYKN